MSETFTNRLEELLISAKTVESDREEFYKVLLESKLILLAVDDVTPSKRIEVLEKKTTVNIITFEEGIVPIFTSIDKVREDKNYKDHQSISVIKGKHLFSFKKGSTYVLNPLSKYRKILTPDEIEEIS